MDERNKVDSSELKIKKRDGRLEGWNYDKALTSIEKAMMPLKKAEEVTKEVEAWLKKEAKKGQVTSTQVRDKIIEILSKVDSVAADSYQVYKKP